MKFSTVLLLCSGLWLGACQPDSSTPEVGKGDVQTIDTKQIHIGTVVHDSLTKQQVEQITRIQATFAEVYPVSLAETINNFQRDVHPDREIAVWEMMAAAYTRYLSNQSHPLGLPHRKEAFTLLLMRSMMPAAEAKRNANLQLLTTTEVERILAYYEAGPSPIVVKKQ
ncbi:hypothetical protein [Hymenobacter canadensis]|uniref:Uncharacterized protein n=1 Tax=Hymenobacter canadensis TaxID=2999067 RepID=A0ABY7LQK7_9BACT|nr:hypothetical protein [Hymenobacter canadensis]WBA42192.1 hypothetical protein O3303_01230 [Hymenobacter canadensis]